MCGAPLNDWSIITVVVRLEREKKIKKKSAVCWNLSSGYILDLTLMNFVTVPGGGS